MIPIQPATKMTPSTKTNVTALAIVPAVANQLVT